jgi:hypothetical protein
VGRIYPLGRFRHTRHRQMAKDLEAVTTKATAKAREKMQATQKAANEAAKANVQRAKQVGGSGLLIDCE